MNLHRLQSFNKRWAAVCLAVLCIALISACTDNAPPIEKLEEPKEPLGSYRFVEQIYMHPASSFIATEDFREYYNFTETSMIISDIVGMQELPASYALESVDEETFKADFSIDIGIPDISSYKERYQYTLTAPSESPAYRLYLLDEEIWLAKIHHDSANKQKSEYIWSIYKIEKLDPKTSVITFIEGTKDNVDTFLALNKDFTSGYDNDICYNITSEALKISSGYQVFKYDTSSASFLLYENTVYPLGEWMGGMGVTSFALADLNKDDQPELYFTYSFGSGMHRSLAAYFDPAIKQVVNFDYVHFNKDMLVANNADGGLSLYDAKVTGRNSFASFVIEGSEFIGGIEYRDGQIALSND